MKVKLFEVRDRATMIPVIAIQLASANMAEWKLLSCSGYGITTEEHQQYILVGDLEGGCDECHSDPFKQKVREIREAHLYILDHWRDLDHGSVIDLEYIRGAKATPAKSDL